MALTLSGSDGVSGVNGTIGNPALIGADPDTGISFSTGELIASINGVPGNVALISGTAQASTSGTSIDFTGIPSWVKRVTVMFQSVSQAGASTAHVQIRLGTASGYVATGYVAACDSANFTTGFGLGTGAVNISFSYSGAVILSKLSGNLWVASGSSNYNNRGYGVAGHVDVGGTVDRVQMALGGTDTFDAGSINILYE